MYTLSTRRWAKALSALFLTTALTAPAFAADDATPTSDTVADGMDGASGPAIVVTARHRDESLQSVPLAISAVSGAELAAKRLDRVSDYAIRIPNFNALQQNTRVSALSIRGLGGNASNDGAEGGVGLIVDGVFFTHVGFSWLDFVDLESIQVVRGPQGTLLGKNTTIGAVIVQTQKPSFDPSLTLTGTYGNYGAAQLRVNATGPIIDDKLAYRLTFATSQGGGWIRNAYDGHKYLDNNRWSLRGQLLFTPTPNLSSRLIAEHYESREYNNYYPVTADVNQNLNLDGSVLSQRTASWTNKLESRFGYTPSFDAPNNANLDNQGRLVSKVDGLSNEVNWDLGGVKLTSVSAWRRLYFRPYNDSDNSPYDIYRGGYDVDVNQYSQEFRLASNGTHTIDWQVGTYYLHEDLRSNLRTIYGSDASTFFLGSGTDSAILNGVEYDRDGHLHIDSIAGFGQLTWHVTSKLSLTGGLRYSYEKKSVNVTGYQAAGADVSGASLTSRNAFLASLGGTTAAQAGAYDLSAESDRGSFSWLVNPAWQVNENVLLYASASHGEKSGAANTSATYAQANVILTKPEKSTDFEGGIKTTWANGRVTANLNFYNDTITDYQGNRIDTSNPSFGTYLANVGKVRMRGFEFEASARPIPVLSINVNTSYNDAKYLSYDDAPAPLEYQAALGGSSATLSLTGYQVIGAPKWTVQGGLDLDQPLSDHLSLTAYANTSWRSRTAMINPRSIYGWQDNYAVLDAGIGVKAPDGSWSLQAWARNLTNAHYAVSYSSASAAAPITEVLGNPRTYGVTFSHRF